jgi:hypothetical protein
VGTVLAGNKRFLKQPCPALSPAVGIQRPVAPIGLRQPFKRGQQSLPTHPAVLGMETFQKNLVTKSVFEKSLFLSQDV